MAKIQYTTLTRKQWESAVNLVSSPNVETILSKLKSYGPNAIVAAGDVLNRFSGISQVNAAFTKNGLDFRLRIVQNGYQIDDRSNHLYAYPYGYLVQIALKKTPQ